MAEPSSIRTVLVATDFSDTGQSAVAWGAELAHLHAAQLVLFHALMPPLPSSPAPEFVPLPVRFHEDLRAGIEERLARAAAELRASGLRVETDMVVGAAAATILAAAQRWRAGVIVAGTRGSTGWRRVWLGSTAAHLVRDAHGPVLTVHPADAGRHRPVRTVLVPTDFSRDAELAVEASVRLLHPAAAESRVVLLHVFHVPVEFVAPLPAPVLLEDLPQVEAAARLELERIAAQVRGAGLRVEVLACEGYPPQTITQQAADLGADLVAMGTHGRSGLKRLLLGSTAERVLAAAPCPVLTIRRPPGE